MSDPSWQRNCDLLARSLQSIARKTASIRRSTTKLISIKDINRERSKVKDIISSANSVEVQEVQGELKLTERYLTLHPSYSAEGMKLTNDAKAVLLEYQRVCDAFYQRCVAVEETTRGRQNSRVSRAFRDGSGEDDDCDIPHEGQALLLAPQVAFERDLAEELMLERQRETSEIAENVRDINEIFQHINEMVNDQGVQLDVVEGNLSTAERATRNATDQLRRAQQYQQSSSRNQLLLIFVIVMFILVSFGLLMS